MKQFWKSSQLTRTTGTVVWSLAILAASPISSLLFAQDVAYSLAGSAELGPDTLCGQFGCDSGVCAGADACGDAVCSDYFDVSDESTACFRIGPSDHQFCDFISPLTNPFFFEDPRTLTEIRSIYSHHKFPLSFGGGGVNLYATQFRVAIAERVSLIVTKAAYLTTTNPAILDGWSDLNFGVKWNVMRDPEHRFLLTTGVTYEAATGSAGALQGNGDGQFHGFLSAAKGVGCWAHWMGAAGAVIPVDGTDESQWAYLSQHVDLKVSQRPIYLFLESNWYHYLRAGGVSSAGIEGGDIYNFGSTGVAGNNIVTAAFGLKLKPNRHTEFGMGWEFPVTKRRDVLDNRFLVDLILRF